MLVYDARELDGQESRVRHRVGFRPRNGERRKHVGTSTSAAVADSPKPTADDFRAADAVLRERKNALAAGDDARDELRNFYASLSARFGADKFALRFGLRKPRSPLEEWEVAFFRQQITEDEFRTRVKGWATRPVDRPMLQKFFSEYDAAVESYANVLQLVVQIATDQHGPDSSRRREQEVDVAVGVLDGKFDLLSTELITVSEFLTQVQSGRAEPIKCGDYTGDSAHWIAALAFSHTSQAWKSCKETADRSRRDPRYLYATKRVEALLRGMDRVEEVAEAERSRGADAQRAGEGP
jgi:hypothetical protein